MKATQNAMKAKYSLLFIYEAKKPFYRMNGVRVSTVIVSVKVATRVRRSFISRLPICDGQILWRISFGDEGCTC